MEDNFNLEDLIKKELDDQCYSDKGNDGLYEIEVYADYRDEMDNETAAKLCAAKDPFCMFRDWLCEGYQEVVFSGENTLKEKIKSEVKSKFDLSAEEWENIDSQIDEVVTSFVYWKYPEKHFLRQTFYVNIMLDTGDGNYDYSLNSFYPCWYGDFEIAPDNKSSLLWLARQQGYAKDKFWESLRNGKDIIDPHGFLESCHSELINLPSHMATTTFLVQMTLESLILLNRCINLQDRNGRYYDSSRNPYCGYITLGKETTVGLFDPWAGGGSLFEIQLERDVKLPIRLIRSALPDGTRGQNQYSVGSVYGMCESAWTDSVKRIQPPLNIEDIEALQ